MTPNIFALSAFEGAFFMSVRNGILFAALSLINPLSTKLHLANFSFSMDNRASSCASNFARKIDRFCW